MMSDMPAGIANCRVVLQAVVWTAVVLGLLLPLVGLLGPRPGAPMDAREFGLGGFWLTRIVETVSPTGASWRIQTNWSNLLLCAAIGGAALTWIRARLVTGAELSPGMNLFAKAENRG